MQWTQVLYVEVPVFHGIRGSIGGQKRGFLGSKTRHFGLSGGGPRPFWGGPFFIYRGTGSGKLRLTVVNHPPDSVFGGHSVTIFGHF